MHCFNKKVMYVCLIITCWIFLDFGDSVPWISSISIYIIIYMYMHTANTSRNWKKVDFFGGRYHINIHIKKYIRIDITIKHLLHWLCTIHLLSWTICILHPFQASTRTIRWETSEPNQFLITQKIGLSRRVFVNRGWDQPKVVLPNFFWSVGVD